MAESEERAFAMARRAVDLHDTRFVESIQLLGQHFDERKNYDRAEWLYRKALGLAKPVAQDQRVIMKCAS